MIMIILNETMVSSIKPHNVELDLKMPHRTPKWFVILTATRARRSPIYVYFWRFGREGVREVYTTVFHLSDRTENALSLIISNKQNVWPSENAG